MVVGGGVGRIQFNSLGEINNRFCKFFLVCISKASFIISIMIFRINTNQSSKIRNSFGLATHIIINYATVM